VPFNDTERLHEALATDDVAIVLTEPAMTNQVHFVEPAPDWHTTLRELTHHHGTLLALDETHTHVVGRGGATGLWHLDPDIVTLGKSIAGGIPLGAYGVTAALADELHVGRNVATGGTLFGNPLSAAAARATLTEVLTPAAYRHATALGGQLADGIQHAIDVHGLPWTAIRFGPRSGQWYGPAPSTSTEALALAVANVDLTRLIRIWLANRGIWEALPGAGPNVPLPATSDDIRHYLTAYDEQRHQAHPRRPRPVATSAPNCNVNNNTHVPPPSHSGGLLARSIRVRRTTQHRHEPRRACIGRPTRRPDRVSVTVAARVVI
jgi:glutamate-1-semialdehyde 2,1-aminomutase